MKQRKSIGALLATVLLATAGGAAAAPGGADTPALEPAAATVLRSALGRIAAARNFTFSAEVASDAPLASGERIQFSGRLKVAVRRPDGMMVAFDGEPRSTRSWYDGETFTHFDPGGNAYAICDAPPTLEGLFPLMREQLGFTPPLSLLLHENVEREAVAGLRSGYAVGPALVGGAPTTHLAFRGEQTDLQVWISEESSPLIRRIVITSREEPGAPQFAVTFTGWDFDAGFAAADFAFSPPAGAVLCDFLNPGGEPEGRGRP